MDEKLLIFFLVLVLGTIMIFFAIKLLLLRPKSIAAALKNDTRPPVLFLREFACDGEKIVNDFGATWATYEEKLRLETYSIGPLITVGDPRDLGDENSQFKHGGAARVYLSDEWRETVIEYMSKSAAIVMRPALTRSVVWEVEQIVRYGHLNKTILFIQMAGSHEKALQELWYKKFRKALQDTLPFLPEFNGRNRYIYFKDFKAISVDRADQIPLFKESFRFYRGLPKVRRRRNWFTLVALMLFGAIVFSYFFRPDWNFVISGAILGLGLFLITKITSLIIMRRSKP